jgi:hypothetical protein
MGIWWVPTRHNKKTKKKSQFLHYVMPLDMGITKLGLPQLYLMQVHIQ